MNRKLTVYFSGTVQGVGFRFTADRIARKFNVTGFVRNLPDGRVMVLAEGDEDVLEDFLSALRGSTMADYIRNVETEWGDPEGKYGFFGIVH